MKLGVTQPQLGMTGSCEWTPAEGAPGRAARSPAIAAVLLSPNRVRGADCRKPNGFDAEKLQEIAQGGYRG